FRLWFDELMNLWMSVQNQPSWEGVSTHAHTHTHVLASCSVCCFIARHHQPVVPAHLSSGFSAGVWQHLVNLFARLANDNIGYVDWTPYLPTIFTRILRSLNLPVGVGQMAAPRYLTHSFEIGHVVL
ncbi:unnamed protein product, partial [Tetraodon nigroviridis]